jgi:hypothetical protein
MNLKAAPAASAVVDNLLGDLLADRGNPAYQY